METSSTHYWGCLQLEERGSGGGGGEGEREGGVDTWYPILFPSPPICVFYMSINTVCCFQLPPTLHISSIPSNITIFTLHDQLHQLLLCGMYTANAVENAVENAQENACMFS